MLGNLWLVVLISLFIAVRSHAQQASYRFKTWNTLQGLTANTCLSLLEDRQGFVWVGTINGLNRFSGTQINEETGHGSEKEILYSEIRDIVRDSEDVFWLGSFDYGLVKLDRRKPAGQRITLFNPLNTKINTHYSVNRLLDDGMGSIWISIESKGLFRFNKKSGTFTKWPVHHPYSKYAESIRCFYLSRDGKIWVGIVNGLIIIDPATGSTTYPLINYKGVHYNYPPTIRSFCFWNSDTLAIATDRGAHFYKQSSHQVSPLFDPRDSVALKFNEYNDVIKFSNNELWFATTDRGLMIINPYTHHYSYAHVSAQPEETIPPLGVNRLLKDQSGNIWAAHQKGFSFYNTRNNVFRNNSFSSYIDVPPIQEQISSGENDIIYYCQPDNIYSLTSPEARPKPLLPFKAFPSVRYISKYPGKGILFQNTSGIFLFDEQKKTVRQLPLDTAAFTSDFPLLVTPISDLLPDTLNGNEVMWIVGFYTKSLYLYNWSDGRITRYQSTIYSDTSRKNYGAAYTRIKKDKHGGLWLASSQKGIFYIPDRNKDEGHSYYSQAGNGYQLPGDNITELYTDRQLKLWASIKGIGLIEIDWNKPFPLSYILYSRNNGLTNLNLKRIQSDGKGNLWISSSSGLFCFDPATKWFRRFTHAHGIRNEAFNMGSCTTAKGELLFTSDDNLLQFNPTEVLHAKIKSRLLLRQVSTSDRSFVPDINEQIELEAKENSFTIDFDLLDFENSKGQAIIYQLEGYDKQWQMIHDIYQLRYTNIPGGNYALRIKTAISSDGMEQSLSIPIHLSEHFHKQTGFRLAVVVLVFVFMIVSARFYIRQKLKKQQKIFERERALQAERLRISSELHDDLGSELSTIYLLAEMMCNSGKPGKHEDLVCIADKSQELLRNMNEIVWSLNYRNDTLQGLIAYTRQHAANYLEQLEIRLYFHAPLVIPALDVKGSTRRNIFLVVKEALHNIVKHASASEVTISFDIEEALSIHIEDNGKGMQKDESRSKISNGLRNMRERVLALNGALEIHENCGTQLLIRIPIQSLSDEVNGVG